MILGIALVVDELHKGQRLVFRYPETVPTSLPFRAEKGLSKLYAQYFAISQDNFAKLFRPKVSLLNKVLEIVIDDLHFISYPCQCQTANDIGSTDSKQQADICDTPTCATGIVSSYSLSMFNVVIVSITNRAMRKICPDLKYKCQLRSLSAPGADPVAAALALRDAPYGICSQTLKRVIEAVSSALSAEERRTRYVTRQVSTILQLIDIANKSGGQLQNIESADTLSQQPNNGNTSPLCHTQHLTETLFSTTASTDHADCGGTQTGDETLLDEAVGPSRSGSCPPTVCEVVSFERTNRSVSNASINSVRSSSDAASSTYQPPAAQSRSHSPAEMILPQVDTSDEEVSDTVSDVSRASPTKLSPTAASTKLIAITNEEVVAGSNAALVSPAAKLSLNMSAAVGGGSLPSGQLSPGPIVAGESAKSVSIVVAVDSHSEVPSSASAAQGWGTHLLSVVLKRSTLADELRLLFHSLTGSQSLGLVFNAAQTCNVQLYCKDTKQCEDSVRNVFCGASNELSGRGGAALRMSVSQGSLLGVQPSAHGSSSGHRQRSSFVGSGSSAAVAAITNSLYDFAKQRGISLETETALGMADVDTVISVLRRLLSADSHIQQHVEQQQSHQDALLQSYLESGRLRTFLEAADPTLSFFDLSLALNEPVEELVVMAAQLQTWGLLEVVSILCNQSVFRVHSHAPTHRGSRVARAFESFLTSLHIDFDKADESESAEHSRSGSGKTGRQSLSVSGTTGGSSLRKSHSYSVNSSQALRARADSDGNVKHVTSSGAISSGRSIVHHQSDDEAQHHVSPRRTSTGRIILPLTESSTATGTESSVGVNRVAMLDALDRVPPQFSLPAVLSLFDGCRTVREVVLAMERPLQRFGVNVVVFLLRWHMLSESHTHMLNLSRLPLYSLQDEVVAGASISGTPAQLKGGNQSVSELAQQSSATVHSAIQQLNVREHVIYDKMAPFVHNHVLSHKTLSEVLWGAQISEAECARVLAKLPHLKIHKN